MAAVDMRAEVYAYIRDHQPTPLELLMNFRSAVAYQLLQDFLREMLETGAIQFGSDRRLRVPRSV
jgi:hypothetical protein